MSGSVARRVLEGVRSLAATARERFDPRPSPRGRDGLPLPSPHLRRLVAGTADEDWFLEAGRAALDDLAPLVAELRDAAVLDFGCGCGRVARGWRNHPHVALSGVDTHPLAIRWCKRHLPGRYVRCALDSALPFADGEFDLAYALSVLTHLSVPRQERVLDELARTLKPGGRAAISLHGAANAAALPAELRARFDAGEIVLSRYGPEGSNDVNAFHPHAAAVELFSRSFDVEEFRPSGASGNPPQDLYLLRKKGGN
jgi:SAM-dependent methyltransferase